MGFAGRDVHLDVPLTNVAIAYKPEGFIADQLFPIVPVQKQSNAYYVWNIADAFRVSATLRAPGTEANIIERNVSSGTFFCKNYALKDRIPYEDIANADAGFLFTERSNRIEFIKDKLYLDWEYRIAQTVTSGSNCGSYSAVASGWTGSGADPIDDLWIGMANVEDVTGQKPNSIIFGRQAWRSFRNQTAVLNKFYGTAGASNNGRIVTPDMVKGLFELDRVLIGGAYRNTNDEGQSASLSLMWGDHVLIYYAPTTPRVDKPSFGYSFRWNGVQGMDMGAEVFQDEKRKAEEVQLGYFQDEKLTASALSFLITNVSSTQSGI
jgi:hypothetical protein